MIHHVSVAANDPKAVAEFFAAVTDGSFIDFPPNPGSYMAFAPDAHGTGVEVYPAGSIMVQNGEEGAAFERRTIEGGNRSATHFALSVAKSASEVEALAKARGWDCFTCSRGGHFHVVEVWIENAWLIELLPPAFAEEYVGFANAVSAMADPTEALSTHQPNAKTLELA